MKPWGKLPRHNLKSTTLPTVALPRPDLMGTPPLQVQSELPRHNLAGATPLPARHHGKLPRHNLMGAGPCTGHASRVTPKGV